jgi:uncharacterized protein
MQDSPASSPIAKASPENGDLDRDRPKIETLMIYPVKSCRGISVQASTVWDQGLEHDRQWMIVDAHGVFLTQRECPEMARIVPSLHQTDAGDTELFLQLANAQGQIETQSPSLTIGMAEQEVFRRVIVWKFEGQAIDCGHAASKFLSDFLQRPVRLVRFSPTETRNCNTAWTGALLGKTYFSDGFPILVLGQASVLDLAGRLKQNLAIERFRPNIVISGLPAYEEDFIQTLVANSLGPNNASPNHASPNHGLPNIGLKLVKPCPRCPIPKVDPWTGAIALFDPAAELATYRYHQAAEGAVLGMNALAYQGQGQKLAVGQSFEAIYDF